MNVRLVLGTLAIGSGGTDLADFLAFAGLPNFISFCSGSFHRIETLINPYLLQVAEQSMERAREEEVKMTLLEKGICYDKEWKQKNEMDRKQVALTTSFDMGWNKRSSGRRYDSLSGHGFLLGCRTNKIIDSILCSKKCATCSRYERQDQDLPTHTCPKNYTGSSKAMEADGLLQAYIDLYRQSNGTLAISHVVTDDDSSMRALVSHHSAMNKKGVLPVFMPEPEWLVDPSHRTKVVAQAFYELANQKRAETECTSLDALRMKINWSSFIKQNRHKTIEEIMEIIDAPLEHMFHEHAF